MDGRGGIFGYFFGPKLDSMSQAARSDLEPSKAIWLNRFGDLGILNQEWAIFDHIPNWNREEWPMPPLFRIDRVANRAWLSFYDDRTFDLLSEKEVDPILENKYPYDIISGYGAVEIYMSKLLL